MLFSSELAKGTIKAIVLKALLSHSRMYGYELAQYIKENTDNSMPINEGDLYPILFSLEAQGIVIIETETIGKRVRKYYRHNLNDTNGIWRKVAEIKNFFENLKFILCNEPQTI